MATDQHVKKSQLSDIVQLEVTGKRNNIFVMHLNNKPVNVFTLALFQRITSILNILSRDPLCDGVIVLSNFGKTRNMFAAGLDLTIFAKNDRNLSRKYLGAVINTTLAIHKFGKPIIFGINGKNIASGAILCANADYRIITKSANIHYIESQISLPIPQFAFDSVQRIVGNDTASYIFQTAYPLNPNECKELGLVNEIVNDDEELMKRAIYVLENKYFNGKIEAAKNARYYGRKQYIDYIEENFDKDVDVLYNGFYSDEVQQFIRKTLNAAKKRSKKKKTAKL